VLAVAAGLFALWLLRRLRQRMREEDIAGETSTGAAQDLSAAQG
jgi:hypothetical protein